MPFPEKYGCETERFVADGRIRGGRGGKKLLSASSAHSRSFFSPQECIIQPTSVARAAPLGLASPKLRTVQCKQGLRAGLFFLASDRVRCGSALAVVGSDLACCRERCVWCHLNGQAAVAHPGVPARLPAAGSSPCAKGGVTCLHGNIVSSCGSQSFLRSHVGMGGQPERVGAPITSVQHQSISH